MPLPQQIMCRIAGIINQQLSTDELQARVTQMCLVQAHGGPDDEGVYCTQGIAFGHRRLAIIDLSERGHQPMADAKQSILITFNGEIYNYQQLKADLANLGAVFETETDTEVIIQAYLYWGKAAFSRLRGMFAFALYDAGQQLSWLVRDSSGIKPLYYYADGQLLVFASEVRAIKVCGLSLETDEQWPIRFLAFGHIPEPYTTLKNVFSLPKGHYLCWDHTQSAFIIDSFTQENTHTEATIRNANIAEQCIREVFDTAITRQLIADAPIGVFLSGGVDSSIITMLADQHTDLLKTVSIYFDEDAYNERRYQQTVLEQVDAEAYQHLVAQQDFETALPQIIADMDLPTTDGINSWFISKYARQSGLKAVLSGIGADELFGGYPSFNRIKYLQYLKYIPGVALNAISRISLGPIKRLELLTYRHPIAEYLFLRGLFTPSEIARILGITKKQVEACLFADKLNIGQANNQSKAAWFETNLYMQNQLLRDTDVMSMAHGLEVRVPFLDEELQQLVSQIDPAIRFDGAQQKKLLIDTYKNILPETVWKRRKMGFSFPLQQWMQQHEHIGQPDFYQNKTAKRLIKNFRHDKMHWSKAFALYHLQIKQPRNYQSERKKLLFLTLNTFRTTGGVQKMGRTMGHALQCVTDNLNWSYKFWAGYDHQADLDTAYARPENFKGFNKNRSFFAADAIQEGIRSDIVILSHINLATVGCMIKKLSPETEVWLIAHGIEIWRPMQSFKKQILQRCDKVLCVSNYTRNKVIGQHQIPAEKCTVLNNALDPQLKFPQTFNRPQYLMDKYGLSIGDKIVFSLTRLASTEQYKGYEHVITAVSLLKQEFANIKYVLSGQYDAHEEQRIRQLIKAHQVEEQVIITGFVDEAELEDHFLLADLFVLPSKKEGFGIVFIEAMACGLPVICGNADGSLDAIKNGELGTAIDVDNVEALTIAIKNHLNQPFSIADRQRLQEQCIAYFNIDTYKQQLEQLLLAAVSVAA